MDPSWLLGGFIAGILVLALVGIWAGCWAHVRRAEIDARLKQDMLARGLSVEEIERLLNASPSPTPVPGPSPDHPSSAAFSLAGALESMVQAGRDTPEIAAFLEAFLERSGEYQALEPTGAAAGRSDIQRLSSSLAPAVESMIQAERDTAEIAAFLDNFLLRGRERPEKSKELDQPPQPVVAAVRSSDIQSLGSRRDG